MLSTLFTEILNRDNWLILMDYILLNFKQTHIMLFLPVAILRLARVPLLHAGRLISLWLYVCTMRYIMLYTYNVCYAMLCYSLYYTCSAY